MGPPAGAHSQEQGPREGSSGPVVGGEDDEPGADRACSAHLVCPDCGAVVSGGHNPGLSGRIAALIGLGLVE